MPTLETSGNFHSNPYMRLNQIKQNWKCTIDLQFRGFNTQVPQILEELKNEKRRKKRKLKRVEEGKARVIEE